MLRFGPRDLLWLTLVVALIVGWWLDHSRTTIDRDHAAIVEKQLRLAKQAWTAERAIAESLRELKKKQP